MGLGYGSFLYGFDAAMGKGASYLEELTLPVGIFLLGLGSLLNLCATLWGGVLLIKGDATFSKLGFWPFSLLLSTLSISAL